jgi:hypothetical protein
MSKTKWAVKKIIKRDISFYSLMHNKIAFKKLIPNPAFLYYDFHVVHVVAVNQKVDQQNLCIIMNERMAHCIILMISDGARGGKLKLSPRESQKKSWNGNWIA